MADIQPPPLLTPDQIQEQAQVQANAELDPLRQDILQQQSADAASTASMGQSILAAAQAVANIAKGVAPAVQDIYSSGAKDTAAFAAGYSDTLRMLEKEAAGGANSILSNIGAPEGQMLHPSGASGDVAYGLGGVIPARTMEREGAAFSAAASFLPTTIMGKGQQDFMLNAKQGAARQKEFARQLQLVDAKYPGLLESLVSNMNNYQLQVFAATLQAKWLDQQKAADIANTQANTTKTYAGLQKVKNPKTGKMQWIPVGYHINAKGNVVKDAAAGSNPAAKKNKDKQNAWVDFQSNAYAEASNLYDATKPNPKFDPLLPEGPGNSKTTQKYAWQQAYNALWNKYAPKLLQLGWSKSQITKILKKILAQAGFKPPPKPANDGWGTRPDDRPGPKGP